MKTQGTRGTRPHRPIYGLAFALLTGSQVFAQVHHFSFSPSSGVRTSTVPFSVTLTARDISNNPVPSFSGSVALSATGSGGPIILQPTNVVFAAGQWAGNITLFTPEPLV